MNDRVGTVERYTQGPLGTTEGDRAEIDHASFVEINPLIAQMGLASKPNDSDARVIVGRKGSGKTIYLRRFQAHADGEKSVVAIPVDPRNPTTHQIIEFSHWYRGHDLTERWSHIWRAAILRAFCTYVLYSPYLSDYGSEDARTKLEDLAGYLFPEVGTPRGPYDQLSELIATHSSGHDLEGTLREPRWGDLEYWLGEFIREAPPIFFYLDAVDDEYEAAPNYWMRCQKGLFYQVMRLLRDPSFGNRLHVVISVRDNVFASVLRSEHATRYRTDPHIRVLAWDRPAIDYFLSEKLARLDRQYLITKAGGHSLVDWLGLSEIWNEARQIHEPIGDYLLRHTRLLPRDIVLLGNALSAAVVRAKNAESAEVEEQEIREVVSMVATWCGNEQLEVCGNQLLGDMIPHGAARKSEIEAYTANQEYERSVGVRIGTLIRALGMDQFTGETLEEFAAMGRSEFHESIDLPTVLWQNGLLGYGDAGIDPDDWIFHGIEDLDRFHLPADRDRYAFHPCLLDALGFHGGGPGTKPVHPWRRSV
jgi:hypothetical protein